MFKKKRLSKNEILFDKKFKKLLQKKNTDYCLSVSNVLTSRQDFSRNLAHTKLFEMIINCHGSIVECGSYRGNSLGLWYNLSSTLEPTNINREIISFDSFEGFPNVSKKDLKFAKKGRLSDVDFKFLKEAFSINDLNRTNGHLPKIKFVVGDANQTIPKYVRENPHLLISLLYLDFDLYEPTKKALEHLLPLVPKGGVVAFDELAQKKWTGETIAFKEVCKTANIKLKKFYFEPHISYYIVGD